MKVTAPRHLSTEWGIHDSYYGRAGVSKSKLAAWLIGDLHIVRLTAPSLIYGIP